HEAAHRLGREADPDALDNPGSRVARAGENIRLGLNWEGSVVRACPRCGHVSPPPGTSPTQPGLVPPGSGATQDRVETGWLRGHGPHTVRVQKGLKSVSTEWPAPDNPDAARGRDPAVLR